MSNEAAMFVSAKPVQLVHRKSGATFTGVAFVGEGRAVVEAVASRLGRSPLAVLDEIVRGLLVKKGADWNATILAEYLGLYEPSAGVFCVVAENDTRRLVAHAVVFQSRTDPFAGLLAHVRTADGWGGFGLGTLVTEEVTRAALARGAGAVVLETDDRLFKKKEGERAAVGIYGKIGYAVLAEEAKPGEETRGWLMAVNQTVFAQCQAAKGTESGEFAAHHSAEIARAQEALVTATRRRYSDTAAEARIEPAGPGDLAGLFLLLSLSPPDDFQMKLAAWGVVKGAELERAFVVSVRPAVVDRDRLEDASLVLRDARGGILAICAARLVQPFSRDTYEIDFYCLPAFLAANADRVRGLVEATIARVREQTDRPRPCRLVQVGVDEGKRRLFSALGFQRGSNVQAFPGLRDERFAAVSEYEKFLP